MSDRNGSLDDLFANRGDPEFVIAQAEPAPVNPADDDGETAGGSPASGPTLLVPEAAPGTASVEGSTVLVTPPAAGERLDVPVGSGMLVDLADPAFDPSRARYEVFDDDLTVTLQNGAVVVLDGFFGNPADPAQLSVVGSAIVPANELLAQTELADRSVAQQIEPAAGEGDAAVDGGGANFTPYSQGSLPPGLDPTGPQPPVQIGFSVDFPELAPNIPDELLDDENNGTAPPTPPENQAPSVSVSTTVDGTIAETTSGFPPTSADRFPLQGNRQPIDSTNINNVDQGNLTIPAAPDGTDGAREIVVTLDGRTNSNFGNTLGYYTIAADGTITDPQIVFTNDNDFSAGDSFNLGSFPAGTKIAFFIVSRGGDLNPDSLFDTGTLEFVNPDTGGPAKISDNVGPFSPDGVPDLIHIDAAGNETPIRGTVYHTADQSQGTTDSNRLNPDFKAHAVSGFDPSTGNLVIGMEDQDDQGDRDFDDVVFQVGIGEATGQTVFFGGDGGELNAVITDPDSATMSAASVSIVEGLQAGDVLALTGLDVDPLTGLIAGTNIGVTSNPGQTGFSFDGDDSVANYETALNAVRFGSTGSLVEAGTRVVEVSVTDDQGAVSPPQRTEFVIENNLQIGTSGNDIIDGDDGVNAISGLAGNDQLRGFGGDDILVGGLGQDALRGGDGNDALIGGPNADSLTGGAGADIFKYTAISDARDTITDFNASEGDRLDISDLIDQAQTISGTTITQANLDQFFRIESSGDDRALRADLDGPGGDFVDVTLVRFDNPSGVETGDLASIITTPPSDGATT